MKIEYRVRAVTRYIVTRCQTNVDGGSGSVCGKGEYENADTAYEVGYALCKAEHDAAGTHPGDENFQYPQHPGHTIAVLDERAKLAA